MKLRLLTACRALIAMIAFGVPPAHAQVVTDKPSLGIWINKMDGNIIGLELQTEQECNLFIEKLLQPRSSRACKYETSEGRSRVFLVGADGNCGAEADFEFAYDPLGPLLRFYIGSKEVLLHKQGS